MRDQVPLSTLLTHTMLCTHILNLNQHNPHPRVILLVSIWSKDWILRNTLKSHLIPSFFASPSLTLLRPCCKLIQGSKTKISCSACCLHQIVRLQLICIALWSGIKRHEALGGGAAIGRGCARFSKLGAFSWYSSNAWVQWNSFFGNIWCFLMSCAGSIYSPTWRTREFASVAFLYICINHHPSTQS